MAKHIIGLKRAGLWVIAMLVVGVYIPGLLPANPETELRDSYCSLEQQDPGPLPTRAWANEIYDKQQWVAGI